MTNDLLSLDVFYGDLTVNRAYIYARLPRPVADAGLSLKGQVRGPRCLHAETLPLSSPLVDLGPGPTLLAKAFVPDPCFWSPDLPAIYDVTISLLRGTETVATARREIGLRSLGVRGVSFHLAGKRWVLRGVCDRSTTATLPRAWHEMSATLVTADLAREPLAEASQFGALAAVELLGDKFTTVALRELACQPGVALAIVRGDLPVGFDRREVAPNVLIAQWIGLGDESHRQPWADAIVADIGDQVPPDGACRFSGLPIIAARLLSTPLPLDQARAACDALQRDLASLGQFAGYIV